MVSILPADEETLHALTKGLPDAPQPTCCLIAADGDERLGTVVYRMEEQTVLLLSLEAGDFLLRDALLRAALNRAESQGAGVAVCLEAALFPTLDAMGFVPDAGGTGRRAVIRTVLRCSCGGRRYGTEVLQKNLLFPD